MHWFINDNAIIWQTKLVLVIIYIHVRMSGGIK